MISDSDNFYGRNYPSFSWGKVTRRIVDPVTFTCFVDVTHVPRIEDCSYETTNIAISQPRFAEISASLGSQQRSPSNDVMSKEDLPVTSSSYGNESRSSNPGFPRWNTQRSEEAKSASTKTSTFPGSRSQGNLPLAPVEIAPKQQAKNRVVATTSGVSTKIKAGTLGSFFSRVPVKEVGDADDVSVSSCRSLGNRSISDLSHAELSKDEKRLKRRLKPDTQVDPKPSASDGGLSNGRKTPIDLKPSTGNVSPNSRKIFFVRSDDKGSDRSPTRNLSTRVDPKPIKSPPSAGRSQQLTSAPVLQERPTLPKRLVPSLLLKSCMKKAGNLSWKRQKLNFRDEPDILEIPTLKDTEHYSDWEAIWYDEDELAEFRYAAFMEEAGLSVD